MYPTFMTYRKRCLMRIQGQQNIVVASPQRGEMFIDRRSPSLRSSVGAQPHLPASAKVPLTGFAPTGAKILQRALLL